jgi:DNA modification methylase
MKKEGSMYLIINDERKESGEMYNIPIILMSRLLPLGFYHIDTIIWEYSTPPTISGKNLVPSFKYIFHLTKSLNYYKNEVGINLRKNVLPSNPNGNSKTEIYEKYRFYKNREWNKEWISENIIRTPRTEPIENSKPSSIVETLPIGLILDSTKEGDIVLNPYNTDETVGLVSLFYDRSFVGFTDNDETTEIQRNRFERFVNEYQKVG